jgi:nitrogenase molybdenum-iron protein beta chain
MPHSHGSQGCCSYHRSHLTRHFKEPVAATTSSFTEGASVFGGNGQPPAGAENIFSIYDPGSRGRAHHLPLRGHRRRHPDDHQEVHEEGKIPEGKVVIHANTPSFVGSHVTGFANMCSGMVNYLAEKTGDHDSINIIPGWLDPSDMRELKRLAAELGVKFTMCPDTSDVLDLPQTGVYEMYPKGGTPVAEIRRMGDAVKTLALGEFTAWPPAQKLLEKCEVPYEKLDAPIGLGNTDNFIDALRRIAEVEVPASIDAERGRLLDVISDIGQYFHDVPVAIFGDPDTVVAMTRFAVELGLKPKYVITGSPGRAFEKRVNEILDGKYPDALVKQNADLFELHERIKLDPVKLILGNTYGKHISRAENIPLVRFGFPILDRVGHRMFPAVGYRGAMHLVEKMSDALLDQQDRNCDEEWFELVQ